MSVDEMIQKLDDLGEEELRRLREAMDRVTSRKVDEEKRRRGLVAMEELMNGLCTAGGQTLSEGIDESVYRGHA